jgi:hypothetical protein
MKNVASMAGPGVAMATAAMSIICLFIPYAYPWPSVAWAMLACVAAVWVAKYSNPEGPSVSDVIRGVEAESSLARAVPVRAVGTTRQI